MATNMHEVGYLMGFGHCNEDNTPSEDKSGALGRSVGQIGGPNYCLNGHKSLWCSKERPEIMRDKNALWSRRGTKCHHSRYGTSVVVEVCVLQLYYFAETDTMFLSHFPAMAMPTARRYRLKNPDFDPFENDFFR
jgi:hypothetical protein